MELHPHRGAAHGARCPIAQQLSSKCDISKGLLLDVGNIVHINIFTYISLYAQAEKYKKST